jgi:hypothetical protein
VFFGFFFFSSFSPFLNIYLFCLDGWRDGWRDGRRDGWMERIISSRRPLLYVIRGEFWPVDLFGAKVRQLTDQIKKAQCDLYKWLFFNLKTSSYFLEKIYIIRQIYTVSSCSSPRFMQASEKTLLSTWGSRHLLRIKAGDPRQCTYLRNWKKKPWFWLRTANWPHLSLLTHGRRSPSVSSCLNYVKAQKVNDHRKLQV